MAKTSDDVSAQVFGACLRATLPGGDAASAFDALRVNDSQLSVVDKFRAHAALWRATRGTEHLAEAWRILAAMRENAPPEYRESMIANVPLHRQIAAAAGEAGL